MNREVPSSLFDDTDVIKVMIYLIEQKCLQHRISLNAYHKIIETMFFKADKEVADHNVTRDEALCLMKTSSNVASNMEIMMDLLDGKKFLC
jgi:hypothetical protein